jgi:hypothetical protein
MYPIQGLPTLFRNFLVSKYALWVAGAVVAFLLYVTIAAAANLPGGQPVAGPAVTDKSASNIRVVTDEAAGTSTPSVGGMGVLQPTGSLAAPAGAVNQGSGLNLQAGTTPLNVTP